MRQAQENSCRMFYSKGMEMKNLKGDAIAGRQDDTVTSEENQAVSYKTEHILAL